MTGASDDVVSLGRTEVDLTFMDGLITDKIPEGFRLEYKRQLDDGGKVLRAICSMANTFGGLILVGVDEDRSGPASQGFGAPGPDGLVGVDPSDKSRLALFCSNRLVPPFDPEISTVDLGNGKVIIVIQVDPELTPRPLMFDDRVMVRTEAGNRPADLFRLRALFEESGSGRVGTIALSTPRTLGNAAFHEDPPADILIRATAIARLASGSVRPLLGDEAREVFRNALRESVVSQWLGAMHAGGFAHSDIGQWWGEGGINGSRRSELRWKGTDQPTSHVIPEARFVAELPKLATPTHIDVSLDIIIRLHESFRLDPVDLYRLFVALLDTFAVSVGTALRHALPVIVGPLLGPAAAVGCRDDLSLEDALQLRHTLRLPPLPQRGSLRLAAELLPHLQLNTRNPDQRDVQAREWLRELLLESGLLGADSLVASLVQ
jgi:hypothetical protein